MSRRYPYGDIKTYHYARHFAQDGSGRVSPLCAKTPRALDGKRNTWTIREEAVTCNKCKAMLDDADTRADLIMRGHKLAARAADAGQGKERE